MIKNIANEDALRRVIETLFTAASVLPPAFIYSKTGPIGMVAYRLFEHYFIVNHKDRSVTVSSDFFELPLRVQGGVLADLGAYLKNPTLDYHDAGLVRLGLEKAFNERVEKVLEDEDDDGVDPVPEDSIEGLLISEIGDSSSDSYINRRISERRAAGFKKYGVTMERDDLSLDEWYNHAFEEALDLGIYTTKLLKVEYEHGKHGSEDMHIRRVRARRVRDHAVNAILALGAECARRA